MTTIDIINVFSAGAAGGNPAPIVLTHPQSAITIHPGFAMGKPSQIKVTLRFNDDRAVGCWLTGKAERSISDGNLVR